MISKATFCFLFFNTVSTNAFSVQKNTNANAIHRIVFGTAALPKSNDPFEMLDAAYEKGIRRFDLARTYGMGESERLFGKWLQSRNIDRSSIDIITKGGIGMDRYGDADRPLLTEQCLRDEVDVSLNTLNLDHVDMYMFHRDDARLEVEQFVKWINKIIGSGKIKRWGVSNWSFDRFRAAHRYASQHGLVPPTANSPQFSLAAPACDVWPTTHSISQPHHEKEIQWYSENGVELLCWEGKFTMMLSHHCLHVKIFTLNLLTFSMHLVLAKGFMAKPDLWSKEDVDPSTFEDPVVKGSDEWRLQRIQKAYCNPENYRRRELAIQLANKSNLKLAQIAMLYPLTKGKHISVIFGSLKPSHVDEMIALQHLNIDESAMSLFVNDQPPVKRRQQFVPFVPQFIIENKNVSANNNSSKRFTRKGSSTLTDPAFSVGIEN